MCCCLRQSSKGQSIPVWQNRRARAKEAHPPKIPSRHSLGQRLSRKSARYCVQQSWLDVSWEWRITVVTSFTILQVKLQQQTSELSFLVHSVLVREWRMPLLWFALDTDINVAAQIKTWQNGWPDSLILSGPLTPTEVLATSPKPVRLARKTDDAFSPSN